MHTFRLYAQFEHFLFLQNLLNAKKPVRYKNNFKSFLTEDPGFFSLRGSGSDPSSFWNFWNYVLYMGLKWLFQIFFGSDSDPIWCQKDRIRIRISAQITGSGSRPCFLAYIYINTFLLSKNLLHHIYTKQIRALKV